MKMKISPFTTNNKNISDANAANKVPRPMNCFMTYRLEKQREIVGKCPGANHRDISKIIAKWWKELTPAEKEPYRLQAEQAKAEHNKSYPGYKFCPKRKTSKPRAYKKRPDNEFTARDFENKKQLFDLYHDGKQPSSTTANNLLLDSKPKKKPSDCQYTAKRSNSASSSSSSPPNLSYPENNKHSSPYNTELLYPSASGNFYSGSSSVPTQSVYSPSPSPYDASDEPNGTNGDCAINYNLYPTHYGYAEAHAYSYPYHHYGAADPAVYYHHDAATQQQSDYHHLKTYVVANQQMFHHHPLVPRGSSEPASFAPYTGYSHTTTASPALLTRPFYYQ